VLKLVLVEASVLQLELAQASVMEFVLV